MFNNKMDTPGNYPNIVLCFHPEETHYPNSVTLEDTCIYCSVASKMYMYRGKEYVYAEYRFQYTANGAIGLGYQLFPESECLGYHEGDTEHLILLLDPLNSEIKHVFFKAHERGQGVWLPFSECEKNVDGNLVAYVARESHAFYPEPITYWRVFGLANDLCSSDGKMYVVVPIQVHESDYIPQTESITFCERFLLPFTKNKVREK